VAHEYDTVERDLERAGITLSRHPSEAGVDWRLTLSRGEQIEAWEPGTTGLSPPPEIWRLIESITAGKELFPARPPARVEPRTIPSAEYGRFAELTRQLVTGSPARPWLAGSAAP
jgi:hypothetical protein